MGFLDTTRDFLGFGLRTATVAEQHLEDATRLRNEAYMHVSEGMGTMAGLAMGLEDSKGWLRVDGYARDEEGHHLQLKSVKEAGRHGAALVTGNPIMHRAAEAQAGYVHGDGVRIKGADKIIEDKTNRANVFGSAALMELEMTKVATGNVLLFCRDDQKILRIPFSEIEGAVYNPEDRSDIRYFLRVWNEVYTDFQTGVPTTVPRKMLYRNMSYDAPREIDLEEYDVLAGMLDDNGESYDPVIGVRPRRINGVEVNIEGVVRHIAPHRMAGGAWGLPDLLAGIFYAAEHKELIEAADSIYRAQSQYAVKYTSKTKKALQEAAAQVAGPPPLDPRTGEPMKYGQTVGMGSDVDMQLMTKIGAGIDFKNFDPIASLASTALGIPLEVVLGTEGKDTTIPFTTKRTMTAIRRMWTEVFEDIFSHYGKRKVSIYWPKLDPDPTHRQVQSVVGLAKLRVASPLEVRQLMAETFDTDWDVDKLPDPSDWDEFFGKAEKEPTIAPGSTEPATITPGQGQTGQVGKLADGDHELRDEGLQDHTKQ